MGFCKPNCNIAIYVNDDYKPSRHWWQIRILGKDKMAQIGHLSNHKINSHLSGILFYSNQIYKGQILKYVAAHIVFDSNLVIHDE